jgi:hypothetical protein
VNLKAGRHGTALMRAVSKGEEMFHELLYRAADINSSHGCHETTLQAAISRNYYMAHELSTREQTLMHQGCS